MAGMPSHDPLLSNQALTMTAPWWDPSVESHMPYRWLVAPTCGCAYLMAADHPRRVVVSQKCRSFGGIDEIFYLVLCVYVRMEEVQVCAQFVLLSKRMEP